MNTTTPQGEGDAPHAVENEQAHEWDCWCPECLYALDCVMEADTALHEARGSLL